MNISIAQGIIGTSAIISAISALMFGVFDDNLYRYRIGRRFGRRHLMLMLIAPSLLIGVLLGFPDRQCRCTRAFTCYGWCWPRLFRRATTRCLAK